jgi:hypothetical protein
MVIHKQKYGRCRLLSLLQNALDCIDNLNLKENVHLYSLQRIQKIHQLEDALNLLINVINN